MEQPCFEGWHRIWAFALGIPCVVVFCLAVPVIMVVSLCLNRSKLQSQSCKQYVGFLYHNYRESRFYWEAVSTLQIGVLVAIAVFTFTLGAFYSAVLLLALFVGMLLLTVACRPLSFRALHRAQLTSLGLMVVTVFVAVSLFQVDAVAVPELYGSIMGVMVAVANVAFMLWCLLKAAVLGSSVLRGWVGAVRRWLGISSREINGEIKEQAPNEGPAETGSSAV